MEAVCEESDESLNLDPLIVVWVHDSWDVPRTFRELRSVVQKVLASKDISGVFLIYRSWNRPDYPT